jgi:FkbM family methyltransferase
MGKLLKIINRNVDLIVQGKELGLSDKLKLKLAPRYKKGTVSIGSYNIQYTDAASFVSTYEEIFIRKIYSFKSDNSKPLIIDCGANIGLSIIFFKTLYPQAKLIAFEPDETIFKLLQENIRNFNFETVDLKQKAVWKSNEDLYFHSQGGLSGSLVLEIKQDVIKVKAFRLKELLNQKVDFLKIDIEGAEYDVLVDCSEELKNVNHLFVEYHSFKNKPQVLDEILAIIRKAGFRYYIQEAADLATSPYMDINTVQEMDLQLNIFAYR